MIVMKFGGSSLASAERIAHCVELVRRERGRDPAVVVSACGKTTNALLAAADAALRGEPDCGGIAAYHAEIIAALGLDVPEVALLLRELEALLKGVSLTRELTPRTRDLVTSFGERLSARIFAAAATAAGLEAEARDAFAIGLLTDSVHGGAGPLDEAYERLRASLSGRPAVQVVTGFLGADASGSITTLGRSGSDFSASIVAAAVGAEEVQIWTDVDGVMTCDPSLDPRAENLPLLSFDEASELAYYGAEVLHPSTLVPAIRRGIPVRVLNTMRPKEPGTRIIAEPVRTRRFAKSVVYKEGVSLLHLGSPRLTSAVKLLSAALETMCRHGVGIHMATTSEATVSLVTSNDCDEARLSAAVAELGRLGRVDVRRNKAIVCVVGAELVGEAAALGRIFGAISAAGINAAMVSQSASEMNVGFLVDEAEIAKAVEALHGLLLEQAGPGTCNT
jgi:aspartate kinase